MRHEETERPQFSRGSAGSTNPKLNLLLKVESEKFEDIVDIAEFRTDFLIGETLAAGVGEMGFEIV